MALPDMSNSMYVARLRYVQSVHEAPEYRNPDSQVGQFLSVLERWRASHLGQDALAKLRDDPFYYYLVARTKYYDDVFTSAVANGVRHIVSIGCGSDTRPYRFSSLLRSNNVTVLECDQPEAIQVKRRIARRWPYSNHVHYLPIDLNDEAWPVLQSQIAEYSGEKTLVMLEGVSPYINSASFCKFLHLVGTSVSAGSHVAYDFKIEGIKETFGRVGRTHAPFRLSANPADAAAFHKKFGLEQVAFELSSELSIRLLPGLTQATESPFAEDGLARFRVRVS